MTSSQRLESARSPPVSVLRLRRWVRAQREDVLRREVVVGVLEFELSWNSWPKVMLGNAAEWKQRLGVREGPAPTIEADHALEIGNRLALNRLPVEG